MIFPHVKYFFLWLMLFVSALNSCSVSEKDYTALKERLKETDANWQLFLDDHLIEKKENIKSALHNPVKYSENPVIRADVPWEENPYCFGTVIFDKDENIFKIWYESYNNSQKVPKRTPVLYSVSKDGIYWERPVVGEYEFNGSKENNIVMQNYGFHDLYSPGVIKDTLDPDPSRRYKMVFWDFPLGKEGYRDDGMCVAFSPDGIHWKKFKDNPVLHAKKTERSISDVLSVMYDSNSGKYVVYSKGWAEPWPAFRQIVRTESDDFIHWSEPVPVITHKHDLTDPQSYGMAVSQFGNNYIGLLFSYKKPGNETIDIQLAVSHDNKKWERVADMQTFIPLGPEGSWDDGMLFSAPLFNHGGKTMIFYSGWDNSHNSKEVRHSGIGMAELRLNGFVSLDAAGKGFVTTKTMKNASGPLIVNADAKNGSLRAEITGPDGKPVEGYSMEECLPVTSDDVSTVVKWRSKTELPEMPEGLKIRFELNNTSLYGFYIGEDATN